MHHCRLDLKANDKATKILNQDLATHKPLKLIFITWFWIQHSLQMGASNISGTLLIHLSQRLQVKTRILTKSGRAPPQQIYIERELCCKNYGQ